MNFQIEGHSLCWMCDNCGNAVVTSYFEPLEIDQTIYHVSISKGIISTFNEIKLISKIANCNFLQAKKMIESAPTEIYKGKAVDIIAIKKSLENGNINFFINPEFPY